MQLKSDIEERLKTAGGEEEREGGKARKRWQGIAINVSQWQSE